jgi:hypothetical protein
MFYGRWRPVIDEIQLSGARSPLARALSVNRHRASAALLAAQASDTGGIYAAMRALVTGAVSCRSCCEMAL